MSGEKRTPVQILQDEMLESRKQLYNIQRQRGQLQQELNNVRKENLSQLRTLTTHMEARDKKQSEVVDSLKSDMRGIAAKHNRQLTEQRNLVVREMQEMESRTDQKVDSLRSWAQDRLRIQRNEYNRIAQQQQEQITELKRDIEAINRREGNREQRARDYLADLDVLIESADKNLPHARYTPGRLEKIKRQLAAARQQLQEDVPSAAIATVQMAHFELMDLEEEIQHLETVYEMTYRTVADAAGGLFASVRQNRHIQLEDDAILQEADYWTNGRYQNLESQVEQIKNELEQGRHSLTTEKLHNYLDRLETHTKEQEALVEEAVERIISSQLRAEMGDVVMERLGQQGYRINNDECGYAGSDQRNAYMMKLSNVAGTEIVTVISPDEKTYQNVLSLNTYHEEVYDDEARRRRNKDILDSLRDGGLQPGETQCNEQSVADFYDVENLLKKGEKKLPRQVLQKAGTLSSSSTSSAGNTPST